MPQTLSESQEWPISKLAESVGHSLPKQESLTFDVYRTRICNAGGVSRLLRVDIPSRRKDLFFRICRPAFPLQIRQMDKAVFYLYQAADSRYCTNAHAIRTLAYIYFWGEGVQKGNTLSSSTRQWPPNSATNDPRPFLRKSVQQSVDGSHEITSTNKANSAAFITGLTTFFAF